MFLYLWCVIIMILNRLPVNFLLFTCRQVQADLLKLHQPLHYFLSSKTDFNKHWSTVQTEKEDEVSTTPGRQDKKQIVSFKKLNI